MISIISILYKTLTRPFYQHHTGFFLLVIGFCFGFMSSIEHRALAQFFVSSPLLLCAPVSCWLLYTLKIILFNKRIIQQEEHSFLYGLSLLSVRHLLYILLPIFFTLLLPVILYAIFLIIIAEQLHQIWAIWSICMSITATLIFSTLVFVHDVRNPDQERKIKKLTTWLNQNIRRPYHQFFIEWTIRKELLALGATKLFSCLMILAICNLYIHENYDKRLLFMGLSLASVGNAFLVFQYHQFENRTFVILRNFPLSLARRSLNFLTIFCVILLPEFIVLAKHFPPSLGLITLIFFYPYCISQVSLLFAILYTRNMALERFIKVGAVITLTAIILLLFTIPAWLITTFNFTLAIFLYTRNFYTFENAIEQ